MCVFSQKDLKEGQKLIDDGRLLSIAFSGGTYQVEVLISKKPKEIVWPFVQMNDQGLVVDAFCTCEDVKTQGSCHHLAAVVLKVGGEEPLHVRFQKSLWNQIGLMASERHGYETTCLKGSRGAFEAMSLSGKRLFSIWARNKKTQLKLKELLFDRLVETEENSIKFSNLSQEELSLWREGRPSPQLSYELSFWADMAKWWMLMQNDGSPYEISFSEEDPPQLIKVLFPDVIFESCIDHEHWPYLIEALRHVDSPLVVHPFLRGELVNMTFLADQGVFHIEFQEDQNLPSEDELREKGIRLGQWIYYPKKGFYPRDYDPLLGHKTIEKSKVSTFFNTHYNIIRKFLKEEIIQPGAVPVQYELEFDLDYNLIIRSYLFEKGDLKKNGVHFFGDWAYLPAKGFYHLKDPLFDRPEVKILRENVSDFVGRRRVWLHGFEGFQTHVSGVESHTGFRFNQEQHLVFYPRLEFTEETEKIQDLGSWIYVAGKGFYEKVLSRPGNRIRPGIEVSPYEISQFIHNHCEELEGIPGFFAGICPMEKSGLHIGFNGEGKIQIDPEFFFRKGYQASNVRIYGDYTYVEGEGFSLIPHDCRLPESYKTSKVIDRLAEPYFVSYELDLLYPHVIWIDPKLKCPKSIDLHLYGLKRDPISKTGSWVLELSFKTDIGSISIREIWEAIVSGQVYLFSSGGLIFLKDPRFDWLRLKSKKRLIKKGEFIRLNTLEFLRLLSVQNLCEPVGNSSKAKKARKLLDQFLHFHPPSPINLQGLKSHLRSYQKTGVDWLWFLYAYGLSGLLCDEMGLGKTHQAMGLIAGIKNHQAGKGVKFLVVCPTSVIYHWEKLIEHFLPELRSYVFHGIGRRFEAFSQGQHDLLLTSYGIVRTENQALAKCHFDLIVFDELQVAKNEKSLTHRALKNLNAKMRVGLSGTPIENRLLELKALFDLILPDYLPSSRSFREFFVNPIEKYGDEQKKRVLSRLIHPFLLRRKKSEVLKELPEKFEEVVLCDLSDEQYRLYRSIVDASRDRLFEELENDSKPPPIVHIFSMLSKLKQVCNHPALIKGDTANYQKHQSGKWDLFVELLSETRDSGQKLVVFSQYLGMLDILRMHLKKQKIAFAEIRGSTRDRKKQVERFEKDPECEVFLGSLQAAGVGIDLVSASVVIHYDRWWNPAKENQATDRVHRIGQKRGVQVFKLMTKNTIEEHIHLLIEKKLALAGDVFGFDGQDQIKGLDRKELVELLTQICFFDP